MSRFGPTLMSWHRMVALVLQHEREEKQRKKAELANALRKAKVHPFMPDKERDPSRGNWDRSQARGVK
jgi:hypothetical protein